MSGRFLELSIATQDIAASLAFYESLGFVQASVGEAWSHPYAVVTDGRLNLGLHETDPAPPLLTFVTPGLRVHLQTLAAAGIEIAEARVDELSLNEATLLDPDGAGIRLLEARTFSPPALDPAHESRLGYFDEIAYGSADPGAAGRFWERLGFVAFPDDDDPSGKVVVASRDLNVAFHRVELAGPVLRFKSLDATDRIAALRSGGFEFAPRVPGSLGPQDLALLRAPDGTQLLLGQADT